MQNINPLKTQLKPICHLLALLGAHHILHVSRIRVNVLKFMLSTTQVFVIMYCSPYLHIFSKK